jgi:hypothetical protein
MENFHRRRRPWHLLQLILYGCWILSHNCTATTSSFNYKYHNFIARTPTTQNYFCKCLRHNSFLPWPWTLHGHRDGGNSFIPAPSEPLHGNNIQNNLNHHGWICAISVQFVVIFKFMSRSCSNTVREPKSCTVRAAENTLAGRRNFA